jgi:tRNA(adenine34) deaminase
MKDDEYFMQKALVEAEKSMKKNEIPVGAVLVAEGQILSRAHNEAILRNDPSAHAEIVALRKACRARNNYRLPDCDLFTTLEPCAMCLGAMVQARIRRLVYGTLDPKAGAVVSIMNFPFEKTNHKMDIKGGVLAEECSKILKDFFIKKREF